MSNSKNDSQTVRDLKREAAPESHGSGAPLVPKNVELVRGVKVRLQVRLGECEMSVGELFDLKPDAVVTLDRDVSAPVDVFLDDRLIARGTLVAAGDNFGVRITEIGD